MADAPPDRPTTDLSRRTLGGLQWTYLGSAVGAVLQIAMAAVLARLLTPAAFGLVALAGVFLRFIGYFSQAGVTQALVQKQTLSRDDIRAGFTLSAGISILFAGIAVLAAPLAGTFAQDPGLVPVLRWLSLGMVIHGLAAPAVALLRRDLRFKPLALIGIGSYIFGYAGVGLAMALTGAGVYALVGAILAQALTRAVAMYAIVRHPLLPTMERSSHRAILGFGARVSVISFLEFLQSNLDTLAVGRFAGSANLGLYNRANLLADLPAYHLSTGLSQVLFPSFSSIQHDHRRLRGAYVSAVGMSAAIILPLNAGIAVAAREIVLVLLGPQWSGAIQVMPWLLLASGIALVGHFAGIVAEAQAALNSKMLVAGGSTIVLAILLVLARGRPLSAYGAALAAAALFSHIGYVAILTRTLETSFSTLMRPYGPAIIGAACVAAAIGGMRALFLYVLAAGTIIVLVAEILTGAVALALLFRIGPLRMFRDDLARRLTDSGLLTDTSSGRNRAILWLIGTREKAQS